ncbi:hypothetical protein QUF64_01005 [Anaerolineales bacterium HSG6]|nr:hypothetical protein [Anaerolineales bacterium HSG6]MDM8530505.1 hypothetical protein [Anaerolineales bacterium HSG25]
MNKLKRLDGPTKVGLTFAIIGILLTIVGIFRDPTTPITMWSLTAGTVIAGGTWGIVSWAIAFATVEVEKDVREAELAKKTHDQS